MQDDTQNLMDEYGLDDQVDDDFDVEPGVGDTGDDAPGESEPEPEFTDADLQAAFGTPAPFGSASRNASYALHALKEDQRRSEPQFLPDFVAAVKEQLDIAGRLPDGPAREVAAGRAAGAISHAEEAIAATAPLNPTSVTIKPIYRKTGVGQYERTGNVEVTEREDGTNRESRRVLSSEDVEAAPELAGAFVDQRAEWDPEGLAVARPEEIVEALNEYRVQDRTGRWVLDATGRRLLSTLPIETREYLKNLSSDQLDEESRAISSGIVG